MSEAKVKVAVRVRPFNKRELDLKSQCVIEMSKDGKTTKLRKPPSAGSKGEGHTKDFVFDHSFWSCNKEDPHFADQSKVFEELGTDVLASAFDGYNACIFAYGQTGSGKSYTMMGPEDDMGVIPRLCQTLFGRIEETTTETMTFKVEVSYMEIYNEKVRDLLGDVSTQKKALKVREHKVMGPYVEGLTKLAVQDHSTITRLMDEGNRSRTVASTRMNNESSRSHAVFTIVMTQLHYDPLMDHVGEKVSKISLVDLAGSERAGKTGTSGSRLKEGANINKSLTTLGLVISALAELSKLRKKSSASFVPYRDSQLTWILKENLGGNSKTVMVAALSPALDNYEETLSTLRYADRAKRIVNIAKINEDPNEAMIRELRDEVDRLKAALGVTGDITSLEELSSLRDKLNESESLMAELNMSWEEKLELAEKQLAEREKALEDMGISIGGAGIAVDMTKSYLINLNADPMLNEMLVYYLKDTRTTIGSASDSDIVLLGLGIIKTHALLDMEGTDMFVTPVAPAETFVNGHQISTKTQLKHGNRLALGSNHLFRVNTSSRDDDQDNSDDKITSWDDAQRELDTKAAAAWEAEKAAALAKQRQDFEDRIAELQQQGRQAEIEAIEAARLAAEAEAEKAAAKEHAIREEVVKVGRLVRKANHMCDEIGNGLKFRVQMQLSVESLSTLSLLDVHDTPPHEISILMEDRAIGETRFRSLDSFMSELSHFEELCEMLSEGESPREDLPRYFAPVGTELIGVAHIFLSQLQHGMTIEAVPTIVCKNGKSSGELVVKVIVEPKQSPNDLFNPVPKISPIEIDDLLRLRIYVEEACGIPQTLSTFVNARFTFFQYDEVMVPEQVKRGSKLREVRTSSTHVSKHGATVVFDSTKNYLYETEVSPELLEYLQSSSLAVQVWGHNVNLAQDNQISKLRTRANTIEGKPAVATPPLSRKAASMLGITVNPDNERLNAHQHFGERWESHKKGLAMWIAVLELSDDGAWQPVGVQAQKGVESGPVLCIRQGFARRISLRILPDPENPLPIAQVSEVRIGDVVQIDPAEAQMRSSSLGEQHVEYIKDLFTNTLNAHCKLLEDGLREAMETPDNNETGKDVKTLQAEWQALVAERDAMLRPEPGSGLPGAAPLPGTTFPAGYENADTVVFQPIDGKNESLEPRAMERHLVLPIVQQNVDEWTGAVSCEVSWDSAAHNTPALLRVTEGKGLIYLHIQVDCRLSNCDTDLTLEKYIVCRVHKRSFTYREPKKGLFNFSPQPTIPRGVGMKYDVVVSLPEFDVKKEETEDVESASATKHFETITASFRNLVQIDRLKQEQYMRDVKITQPLKFDDGKVTRTASMFRKRAAGETTQSSSLPSSTVEIELRAKLRNAERTKNHNAVADIRAQLETVTSAKLQPLEDYEDWVVIESELEIGRDGGSPRISRVVRTPSATPARRKFLEQEETFEDSGKNSDEEEEEQSLVGLFRQKLSNAMDMVQLKETLSYIKVAKLEGSLSPPSLKSLQQLSKSRSNFFRSSAPDTNVAIHPGTTSPVSIGTPPKMEHLERERLEPRSPSIETKNKTASAGEDIGEYIASTESAKYPTPTSGGEANDMRIYSIIVAPGQPLGLAVEDSPMGLIVKGTVPGKSAAQAGVEPGSIVVSCNGISTQGMAKTDCLKLLRNAVAKGQILLGTLPPQCDPVMNEKVVETESSALIWKQAASSAPSVIQYEDEAIEVTLHKNPEELAAQQKVLKESKKLVSSHKLQLVEGKAVTVDVSGTSTDDQNSTDAENIAPNMTSVDPKFCSEEFSTENLNNTPEPVADVERDLTKPVSIEVIGTHHPNAPDDSEPEIDNLKSKNYINSDAVDAQIDVVDSAIPSQESTSKSPAMVTESSFVPIEPLFLEPEQVQIDPLLKETLNAPGLSETEIGHNISTVSHPISTDSQLEDCLEEVSAEEDHGETSCETSGDSGSEAKPATKPDQTNDVEETVSSEDHRDASSSSLDEEGLVKPEEPATDIGISASTERTSSPLNPKGPKAKPKAKGNTLNSLKPKAVNVKKPTGRIAPAGRLTPTGRKTPIATGRRTPTIGGKGSPAMLRKSPAVGRKSPAVTGVKSNKFNCSIGDYVVAGSKAGAGYLRYYGEVDFAEGMWCGVELVAPKGKNDGSKDGKRYFECKEDYGIFLQPSKVKKLRA